MNFNSKEIKIFKGKNYIFIFGFPGSGTTILAKQLAYNLSASLWLEPYYIWRFNLINNYKNNFNFNDFSKKIILEIRNDFYKYYKKSNKRFLIEKEPRNILNFLIIKKIFPEAKFIFIKKKYIKKNFQTIKRKTTVRKNKSLINDIHDIYKKINEQKFLIFKLKLLYYEFKSMDRTREYIKKYINIGNVRWGIKLKINKKYLYVDNEKNFQKIYSIYKDKLKRLKKDNYIVVELEKLALNFENEFLKISKFIGKDNFINRTCIINKKRILNK